MSRSYSVRPNGTYEVVASDGYRVGVYSSESNAVRVSNYQSPAPYRLSAAERKARHHRSILSPPEADLLLRAITGRS